MPSTGTEEEQRGHGGARVRAELSDGRIGISGNSRTRFGLRRRHTTAAEHRRRLAGGAAPKLPGKSGGMRGGALCGRAGPCAGARVGGTDRARPQVRGGRRNDSREASRRHQLTAIGLLGKVSAEVAAQEQERPQELVLCAIDARRSRCVMVATATPTQPDDAKSAQKCEQQQQQQNITNTKIHQQQQQALK